MSVYHHEILNKLEYLKTKDTQIQGKIQALLSTIYNVENGELFLQQL